MDPFDWEHRKTRKRDRGTLASSSSLEASAAPPWAAQPVTAQPGTAAAGTVGIFDALPAPEPPPVPIPPPPPAPVAVSELPTSWVAQSSRAPSGRRSFTRVALALGLVVALAAGAGVFFFGRSGSPGGTALAMSFHQGASWRYRMHLSMDLTASVAGRSIPLQADISSGVQMKVVSIDGSGVATLKLHLSNPTATVNGTPTPMPRKAIRAQTIRISPDGQVLSATLPGVPAADRFDLVPGGDQVAPLLPEGPVQPGDTWSRDFTLPAPFGAGDVHGSLAATLVRYQSFHGVRAAVIEEHGSIPIDLTLDVAKVLQALGKQEPQLPEGSHPQVRYQGSVAEEDTSWFDAAAGRVLSFSSTATVDATISFSGLPAGATSPELTLSGKVAMDLRPPGHHPGQHPAHHSSGDSVA